MRAGIRAAQSSAVAVGFTRARTLRRALVTTLAVLLVASSLAACKRDREVSAGEIEAMLMRGQAEEALEEVRAAIDRDPTRTDLQLLYGRMLVGRRDFYLALFPLREAARDPELATPARLLIAQTQLAIGNSEEALAALGEVLDEEPENHEALVIRTNANLEAMRLDEALADADRLLDEDPDNLDIRLIRLRTLLLQERAEEAEEGIEDLKRRLDENPDAYLPAMHARVCAAEAVFLREKREGAAWYDKALACADEYPSAHVVLQEVLRAHASRDEADEAIARVERALEDNPMDGQIRFMLAEHHLRLGDPEAGERVLREGVALVDPPRAQDWRALYEFFWQQGDFPQALDALEKSIDRSGAPATADLLLLADTLVEAGELARAEKVAEELGEGYSDLVRGRIQLERGEFEAAETSLKAGIRVWPNNPVARLLLGRVAAKRGQLEEAMNQYIEAYRIDYGHNAPGSEKTDSAKDVARIQLALGAFEQSAEFASNHIAHHREDLEAYELVVRAGARGGLKEFVTPVLDNLSKLPGGMPRAVALQGEILAESDGPAAAIGAMRRWKPNLALEANMRVLDVLLEQLAVGELHEEAIEVASRTTAASPDVAVFHALRARTLARAGSDRESIRSALDEAFALDPAQPLARLVMGDVAGAAGEIDAALAAYEAAALDPALSSQAKLAAARLLASLPERREEARTRLESLLVDDSLESRAATLLAQLALESADQADLDRALAWATRAAQFAGALPLADASEAYAVLGDVHTRRNEATRARAAVSMALELDPSNAAAIQLREALGPPPEEEQS